MANSDDIHANGHSQKLTSEAMAEAIVIRIGMEGHTPLRIVKQRGTYRVECLSKDGFPFTVTRLTDARLGKEGTSELLTRFTQQQSEDIGQEDRRSGAPSS